jgi:large subunit ribosomal protein L11
VAKNVVKKIKLQIEAGKATPAPPVGTVLGPAGINLQEFCTKYNEATREKMGDIVPVEISIYEDRTFDFVLKTPPTPSLLLKAAGISKGSSKGANEIVATISKDDVKKIAEIKLPDLNCYDIESAMEIVIGTARNMGIAVKGVTDAEMAEQAAEAALFRSVPERGNPGSQPGADRAVCRDPFCGAGLVPPRFSAV